MAKEKSNGNGSGEAASTQAAVKKGPPAGFRRRSAVTDAPWYKNKEGNVAHGAIIGRYIMDMDPPRAYYQVELYAPCTVTVGRGEEAEEKEAQPGDVINVGETFKLKALKEIEIPEILAGAAYDVYVETEKKIKISGGRTMWVIDVQSKRTKAPTGDVRPLPPDNTSSSDGEDAPF